ncbi:MAG TPA: hypothetical protein VF082_12340 [Jiangellaceae bacterium]
MSTKTVAEKLQIKPNTTVWSSDPAHLGLVEPLPEGVELVDDMDQATTALVFAPDADSLLSFLAAHEGELMRPDVFWVAYPKANRADINRDTLWRILGEHGLRLSRRWRSTRSGPRFTSARSRKANHPSPVDDDQSGRPERQDGLVIQPASPGRSAASPHIVPVRRAAGPPSTSLRRSLKPMACRTAMAAPFR